MCRFEMKHQCPHYVSGGKDGDCIHCPYIKKQKKQTLIARIALVVVLMGYIALTFHIFG